MARVMKNNLCIGKFNDADVAISLATKLDDDMSLKHGQDLITVVVGSDKDEKAIWSNFWLG